MAIEVFNRFENKYLLDRRTLTHVLDVLEQHMEPDAHNAGRKTYPICNLYFDTADDYLIRTSLARPAYKEKLRLRTYGVPAPGDTAYLEIKKKVNGMVGKRRTAIPVEQGVRFVELGGRAVAAPGMNPQVLRELAAMVRRFDLQPRVYIAYDRLAYFEHGNPDLRISFDRSIRTRRCDLRLESGDYGEMLLPDGVWLMEIKTASAMPLWLTHLLAREHIRRQSFSKYGTEYKKYCMRTRKEPQYA